MTPIWLSLAGGLGAVARLVLDGHVKAKSARSFPWGTTLINATGSLLLGILTGFVLYRHGSTTTKLIIGTGFCGGYTTFSTASFEVVRLVEESRYAAALAHTLSNLILTLSFAALGIFLIAW